MDPAPRHPYRPGPRRHRAVLPGDLGRDDRDALLLRPDRHRPGERRTRPRRRGRGVPPGAAQLRGAARGGRPHPGRCRAGDPLPGRHAGLRRREPGYTPRRSPSRSPRAPRSRRRACPRERGSRSSARPWLAAEGAAASAASEPELTPPDLPVFRPEGRPNPTPGRLNRGRADRGSRPWMRGARSPRRRRRTFRTSRRRGRRRGTKQTRVGVPASPIH